MDTLRPDRLECYGYRKVRTPSANRLARDGVRFLDAVAAAPLTLPSHCSILTGTLPPFHGVRDNSGFRLPQARTTLAEILKKQGYSTGAFVGAFVLDSTWGLDQGFDTYVDRFDLNESVEGRLSIGFAEHRAEVVVQEALNWLQRQQSPFFAWVHLYDPHDLYDPPSPFREQYAADPYDGEVAYADAMMGRLLEFLDQRGLYQNTLIALTSDHGESFGEHNEPTHGFFIYESTLRIPLILKFPHSEWRGRVVDEPAQTIDLVPTLLEVLGIPTASEAQGQSLLTTIAGKGSPQREIYAESYYPFSQFDWSPLMALRSGRFKLIWAPSPELYDLEADPQERDNVFEQKRKIAEQLKSKLFSLLDRSAEEPHARSDVDASKLEQLRSLGYVGYATGKRAKDAGAKLPDPKDKIGSYQVIFRVLQGSGGGVSPASEEALHRLLKTESNAFLVYNLLGLHYFNSGEYSKAAWAYEQCRRLQPEESSVHLNLALARMRLGQWDLAEQGLRRSLVVDPAQVRALTNLGTLLLAQGRRQEAMALYRQAIDLEPEYSAPHNNLGNAHMLERRWEDAVAEYSKAASINPRHAEAFLNLGMAYMKTSSWDRARWAFEQALALRPMLALAHYYLGHTYGQLQKKEQARSHFQEALKLKPDLRPPPGF